MEQVKGSLARDVDENEMMGADAGLCIRGRFC